MVEEYDVSRNEFINSDIKLKRRKEELFQSGNITKWELVNSDVNLNELMNNRDMAYELMLPEKTNELLIAKREFAFHLTSLINSYDHYLYSSVARFDHHFKHLSAKHTDLLADVFSMVKLLASNI